MRECVHDPGKVQLQSVFGACKIADFAFIPSSAASFVNYAVGPWVSVAGRGTALARGNPAIRKEEARTQKYQVPRGLSHFLIHNSSFIIRTYANPLRSF